MQNTGTLISATIRPNDTLDPIASAFSNEIKGGHHMYATITERNSIIIQRREWGMLVTIYNDLDINNNKTYQLNRGFSDNNIMNNSNWVVFNSSNSGVGNSSNSWIDSVIDILNDEPITNMDGDRYLIGTLPVGNWFGKSNQVATWNTSINNWIYYVPNEGDSLVVKDELNCIFRYSFINNINGEWIKQSFGGLSIKTYISNETLIIPPNYQYFVYGDLTIDTDGVIDNYGQIVTLNGDLIILDNGILNNYGEYLSPVATNVNEISTYSKYVSNISVVSNIPYDVVHNLDSLDVIISIYENNILTEVDVNIIDNNTIRITSTNSTTLKVNIIS